MLSYLLFFFLTVGAKLVLATVMIYFLLPADPCCSECDGETLLMGGSRASRLRARIFFGRLQWRWCPRCGWEGLSRRVPDPGPPTDAAVHRRASTRG